MHKILISNDDDIRVPLLHKVVWKAYVWTAIINLTNGLMCLLISYCKKIIILALRAARIPLSLIVKKCT
jgi:hypothetical protein